MIAADTLVVYGNTCRYQDVDRVMRINRNTILGGGRDFADVQAVVRTISHKIIEDHCFQDGHHLSPKSLHSWLTRLLYNRRNKRDKLDVDLVIGGMTPNNKPYLGYVDSRGTALTSDVVTTGFSRVLVEPLIRERQPRHRPFTYVEAVNALRECMKVLFYRDTRSIEYYTIGVCSRDECKIKGPFKAKTCWKIAELNTGF
ncbi:PREDICTED: proteasome subunit beta type-4-like [Drosophila arizonae]|uniref:Proteasome subunit beta type-4 n=1 Tax=Drosophila arizonae TaxID=7263 RepID=A0ABM1PQI3_DROAR|nr:PREDICTED: proteasome subunit beta type-4-like [Drosophila arizonae]